MVNDFAVWCLTTILPGLMSFNSTTKKPLIYTCLSEKSTSNVPKNMVSLTQISE